MATSGTARKGAAADGARLVAVIDLGTTSIRMAVAEVRSGATLRVLETLQQAVTLGKDTFADNVIAPETTEACVRALRSFRRVLDEYGLHDNRAITAVATSAVREARNREAFIDRLYMATGIDVQVIDEAEVNRFTCLAVQPLIEEDPALCKGPTAVIEVGGGSTELLRFENAAMQSARSYRVGSVRLRKLIDELHAPLMRLRDMMAARVERSVEQILADIGSTRGLSLLAIGGDIRFACRRLVEGWDGKSAARLPTAGLERLATKVLDLSVDEVVRLHHISFPEAETLGPALLIYARLARALRLRTIHVGGASLREGVLIEEAGGGTWQSAFRSQVLQSAVELGRRYAVDESHAGYVADVAGRLFAVLQDEHRLDARYELLLRVAARLHDIGFFISNSSHHKHSMYLILNSEVFGLGTRDRTIVAMVARYHRRALPQPKHDVFNTLDRESRMTVTKLAAILRVADALGRGHGRVTKLPQVAIEDEGLVIRMKRAGDMMMERQALRDKGDLFRQVYGMDVILRGVHER